MRRPLAVALVAAALLAPLALPQALAAPFAADFRTKGGNEWWVEVKVDANAPLAGVDARAGDGPWRALSLRSWGAWAASFHVPDGSIVQFRATSAEGETTYSGRYVWPSGGAADGGAGGGSGSGGFAASFENVRGNTWWVEADVRATGGTLQGVDARVNDGAWTALQRTDWGSHAKGMAAPDGSIVELRARSTAGDVVRSQPYRWPDATPTGGSGDGGSGGGSGGGGTGAYDATFRNVKGNEWWIQVDVGSPRALAGVDARVDGAAWLALEKKSWGSWASSIHAPSGSLVEFRARATDGATDLSGAYRWPDATPVDDGGSGGGGAALGVRIDAARGPWGGERVDIDRPFYGLNIADWEPQDYRPSPDPEFRSFLAALDPGVLRWPAGHTSQSTKWERTPEESWGSVWLSTGHFDDFVALAHGVGADPLIAVNMKTATPDQAADMVRYANLERDYDITWWQLGNEPDHLDGETSGPEEYASDAEAFSAAMRAVDPRIRLVGGEIMTGAHVVGSNGARDWMTPILQRAGDEFDAVSWHYYPLDSGQKNTASSAYPTVENLFQEDAPDWRPASMRFADEIFPHLKTQRDRYSPGSEIWVTEMAEDSGSGGKPGIVGAAAGMLWTADILGRFAAHGPDAVVKFVFHSGSSHRFTLLDENMDPRPAYYAYWLYAREMGDLFVKAESDDRTKIAAHAALRDDGALSIVLVNKDTSARAVELDVQGFSATRAERFVLRGDSYSDATVEINGATLHAWNVDGESAVRPQSVSVHDALHASLPAYSVTVIVLRA